MAVIEFEEEKWEFHIFKTVKQAEDYSSENKSKL